MPRWTWPVMFALPTAAVLACLLAIGRTDARIEAPGDTAGTPGRMTAHLAVSPYADDVYVAFEFSKFLERPLFDTTGAPKGKWDTPTMHYGVSAIAVNAESGYTWAAWRRLGKMEMHEFSEIGRLQDSWSTGYTGYPTNMAINDLGDLSILLNSTLPSSVKADVLTLNADGTLQDMKSTTFATAATAAARDGNGLTYVIADAPEGGGLVRLLGTDGGLAGEWPTTVRPTAIVVGVDDVLVAGVDPTTLGGAVQRFARDGTAIGRWSVGGRPLSIDIGAGESVYVLTQPSAGLSLAVEKRALDGRMMLRWSVVSRMFLPLVAPVQS